MTLTQPWAQDPDHTTWRTKRGDVTLIVKRLGLDSWKPEVHRPGQEPKPGSVRANRAAAQRWAEREATRQRSSDKEKDHDH